MILSGDAFWIMVAIFSLVFAIMGIESGIYEKMLHETGDMQHTSVKIFKQIKMKYESLCRIGREVNSTRNFVDKTMIYFKICGIRADVISRVEKVFAIGCVYIGLTFSMYVYFRQGVNNQWMIYAGGGLLMWMALKIWEVTLDIKGKKEKIAVLVTDYLENQMYVAISAVNSPAKVEVAASNEKKSQSKKTDTEKKHNKISKDEYDERLIEEVLEEFLM